MNRASRRAVASLRPDVSATTTFAVPRLGRAVVLASNETGRPRRLVSLDRLVAAGLGTELFTAALSALPADEAAARARELLDAAAAFTAPPTTTDQETS